MKIFASLSLTSYIRISTIEYFKSLSVICNHASRSSKTTQSIIPVIVRLIVSRIHRLTPVLRSEGTKVRGGQFLAISRHAVDIPRAKEKKGSGGARPRGQRNRKNAPATGNNLRRASSLRDGIEAWRGSGGWLEKEITRRWTTRFAWKLVSVPAKSYYALSFSSSSTFIRLSFPRLFLPVLSILSLSVCPLLPPSKASRCVRTNTSEKSFTLTNTVSELRTSNRLSSLLLPSLSPFLSLSLYLTLSLSSTLYFPGSLCYSLVSPLLWSKLLTSAHNERFLATVNARQSSPHQYQLEILLWLLPLPPPSLRSPPLPPAASSYRRCVRPLGVARGKSALIVGVAARTVWTDLVWPG